MGSSQSDIRWRSVFLLRRYNIFVVTIYLITTKILYLNETVDMFGCSLLNTTGRRFPSLTVKPEERIEEKRTLLEMRIGN